MSGASGHLGRLIVSELLSSSGEGGEGFSVIAASRDISKLRDLALRGAELRLLDLDRFELSLSAFRGVDVLVLVSTNEFSKRILQHRTAIKAAEAAGVKHVIYTSYINPKPLEMLFNDHFVTETDLAVSGLKWTILRNNCYSETLLLTLKENLERGILPTASGNGRRSFICRLDCASFAAAIAKDSERYDHRVFDVSGDDSYSPYDIASIVYEVTESPLRVEQLGITDYLVSLANLKAPQWWIDIAPDLERATSSDALAITNGGNFKKVVGRDPISLHTFLQMNLYQLHPEERCLSSEQLFGAKIQMNKFEVKSD